MIPDGAPDRRADSPVGWTPSSDALERIAEARATRDVLTGLPNRAVLADRINQALAHDARKGGCTAVISVDLDRFAQVNETHGEAGGDALLRRVSSQLVSALRMVDTVGRIGGSEFAVLTPNVESPIHAVDLSARLVSELARRPRHGDDGQGIAASIGLSVSMDGRGTGEVLLGEAGIAMRRARALGGARAEVFDDTLWLRVQQRWIARQVLQAAIDDRRVVVHYEPIVDVGSGSVVGYEALTRLADTDGSILSPARFQPAADDSSLMVSLTRQVVGLACNDACAWQRGGSAISDPSVAVNVTARQFRAGDLAGFVRETLQRTGLDPGRLHLELHEAMVADALPEIVQQLEQLRELGVQLGLDDFGTGYVSLVHLRRLPLTYVKIHRKLVRATSNDPGAEQVLKAVIGIAADLGLRSIGDGVERRAQLDRLRELGCDEAQGELFATPHLVGDPPSP